VISKDIVVCGFDNGKVMAVSLATGDTVWDSALATRTAVLNWTAWSTWIPRSASSATTCSPPDIKAAPPCLPSIPARSGGARHVELSRLGVDAENLFVTQSDGIVVALRQRDGSEIWRNDKLKRRGLSAPAVTSTAIAVADYQGYLHWLDKSTGTLVARERVAKFRVSSPPVPCRTPCPYHGLGQARRLPRDAHPQVQARRRRRRAAAVAVLTCCP